MTVEELEEWARQWARWQAVNWVYRSGSEQENKRQALVSEARSKIEGLGYKITTDAWANVIIVLPFKV